MKKKAMQPQRAQISQETFDEVVKENMEEFDMDLEEATRDAVQQFESQRVDLSNIIKHVTLGDDGTDDNDDGGEGAKPVSVLDQIKSAISELSTLSKNLVDGEGADATAVVLAKLAQLQELCDKIPEAKVVAGRNNAIDTLLEITDASAASGTANATVLEKASALLAFLCADNTDNQDFVGQAGMERLANVLGKLRVTATASTDNDAESVSTSAVTRVLNLVRVACAKHESNKTHFTKAQGIDVLCEQLALAKLDESLSKHVALVLRVLTVNDDPKATFSQAQETIKQLVAKDLVAYIIEIVQTHGDKPEMLSVWLIVLKQLAITEENCKKIYELQGLDLLQQVMITHEKNLTVMKRCITVFRNVAAADELKEYIIKSGGVERVLTGMRLHLGDPSIQQHACATLAAIALRAPENSIHIVNLGGARQIAFAMRTHRDNTGVLRQASLAIRNMVARCVELRPRILDEDIEPLLRDAQKYRGCGDEAYAALRDLGCDIQLAAFGTTSTKARFNPVNIESNQLLDRVDEAAEAPFAT